MDKPLVFVVIVNWNGWKVTADTLKSLGKLNLRGVRVRLLVVDNNSSDGSPEFIAGQFPEVMQLRLGDNLGFAGGNNRGIEFALNDGADYVWLLNNDTLVEPDALSTLVSCLSGNASMGAVSSKIYFAAGREYHAGRYKKSELGMVIWYAGGIIDWNNVYLTHRGVDEVDRGQYDTPGDTDYLTGCSLLVRSDVLKSAGMFDERYYLYMEDADLSVRIRKKGYRLGYCPESVVRHVNASSSGGPGSRLHQYYQTRNRLLFGMTYAPARTKLALVRESVRKLFSGTSVEKQAVRDALFLRWGKGYEPEKS